MISNPTYQLSTVAAINPDQAQLFAPAAQPLEDEACAISFLYRGGSDHDQQQQAEGINQQMALAPFNLFGCVIAPHPFYFGGLDTLRVQTTSRRMFVAACLRTHRSA